MNKHLADVIKSAAETRELLIEKKIGVKESNAVHNHNRDIVASYAVDLRERIFLAEDGAGIPPALTNS